EDGGNILLDMNFLYPPSCSLNDRWICPLCPPENKLPFRVEAGAPLVTTLTLPALIVFVSVPEAANTFMKSCMPPPGKAPVSTT
ncbi:MAG: DUF1684 domain-containing protein, partial [Hyphomicrobiales bacterium]|nr:DUF1684 domain-containing protein [Hyphomicrobiales bacterium]